MEKEKNSDDLDVKQFAILCLCISIIIITIFAMFFGTICFTSVEKTKRVQIEKFGEEIVRMEDK